jgi:hypothetical protein
VKQKLGNTIRKATELCEKRIQLYSRPDVFAVRNAIWYHNARKLDDYMGPPSKTFRDVAGVK